MTQAGLAYGDDQHFDMIGPGSMHQDADFSSEDHVFDLGGYPARFIQIFTGATGPHTLVARITNSAADKTWNLPVNFSAIWPLSLSHVRSSTTSGVSVTGYR